MSHRQEAAAAAQELLLQQDEILAVQAIAQLVGVARAESDRAQSSLRFTRGYNPSAPGPRPHPEAGGMDHADYEVARLEYTQYNKGDEIAKSEYDAERAEVALDELLDTQEAVAAHDELTIVSVALSERARLQAIIAAAARAEDRKGKEFMGAQYLYDTVSSLETDRAALQAVNDRTGYNGWQRASYRPNWTSLGSVYRTEPGQGPLTSFGSFSEHLEMATTDDGVIITYTKFTDYARPTWVNSDWRQAEADCYYLKVSDDGVVSSQTHVRGPVQQQYYIGSQYSHFFKPTGAGEHDQSFDFTQADVDMLIAKLSAIEDDVQTLQP